MKNLNDHFSRQSATYKKYRPLYPIELYEEILDLTPGRNECWDCGTGNGQVAQILSQYFERVMASDISKNQISNSVKAPNITYSVERAENSSFLDNQFDLITVAQAIHWFDFKAFNKEAKRVLKDGGIIAVWGYGLLHVDDAIDKLIHKFYNQIVGPYWPKERGHIDNEYASIIFEFTEMKAKNEYEIKTNWSLGELEGYFNSWSSVQNYIQTNADNPVN